MKMTRQICRRPCFWLPLREWEQLFSSHVPYQWKLLKIAFLLDTNIDMYVPFGKSVDDDIHSGWVYVTFFVRGWKKLCEHNLGILLFGCVFDTLSVHIQSPAIICVQAQIPVGCGLPSRRCCLLQEALFNLIPFWGEWGFRLRSVAGLSF